MSPQAFPPRRPRRRDVDCGDRIPEQQKHLRPFDRLHSVVHLRRLFQRLFKNREFFDVRCLIIPGEKQPFRRAQLLPSLVMSVHIRIESPKEVRRQIIPYDRPDLIRIGPDVAEIDRLPCFIVTKSIFHQVDADPASQSEGDYQRRRGKVVPGNIRMDPGRKITVPGQHRGSAVPGQHRRGPNAPPADLLDDIGIQPSRFSLCRRCSHSPSDRIRASPGTLKALKTSCTR